jgi:hypothetical protein
VSDVPCLPRQPMIEIEGLHKFGDKHVLRGIDLAATAGEVVWSSARWAAESRRCCAASTISRLPRRAASASTGNWPIATRITGSSARIPIARSRPCAPDRRVLESRPDRHRLGDWADAVILGRYGERLHHLDVQSFSASRPPGTGATSRSSSTASRSTKWTSRG